MFKKKGNLILGLTTLLLASFVIATTPALSQEIGGTLGGSKGVFRAGKKSSTKTAPPKTASRSPRKTAAVKTKPSRAAAVKTKADFAKPKIVLITKAKRDSAANKTVTQAPLTGATERFEQAIAEGNSARDARNYEQAETAYKRASLLKPRDVRAAQGLGAIYIDQQMWDEAEKYFRQTVALDASNFEAHLALSYVLAQPNRGGNVAARFVDAESYARRAIALNDKSAAAHDQLGVALEARGVISDETENAYRRAIELDAEYSIAYAHLARLMRKNGRLKDALETYKKAVEFANDVPSIVLVAEVFQTEQRYEESEQLLRRALTVDESNATALYLLGRALVVKQNHAEAERYLQRSIAVSPRAFYPYMLLGSLYLRTSRFNDAEKTFLLALAYASQIERKQIAGALGLVGDGYMQKKMAQEALRVLRKARELDAENPQLDAKIDAAQGVAARN
jgi:tetratricopeptide (TPR) repeat protein